MENLNNLLGKLPKESINSQLGVDMLIRMDISLHQRVKVQKILLKQPKHPVIFRILQNDEEKKGIYEELILSGYDD